MKKISLFMVLSLILTFIIPFSVFAEQDHFLKVRLISGYFETEYDKNNVIVNYEKTDYSIKATIIDKKTNKVLEIFSEKTDLPISKIQQMKSSKFSVKGTPSTYDTTLDKTQPLDNSPLGAAAYTWARVQMTADFSWAQVNKVYSYGHSAGSSGSYHLTGNQSFLGTTTFPTRRFNIDINGIIETGSTYGVSATTAKKLPMFGFSLTGNVDKEWFARKSYNTSVRFVVME